MHSYIHTYGHMKGRTCVYKYIHTYITHIHTYTHTHTHTDMHAQMLTCYTHTPCNPWVQNLVNVTIGCGTSHKNTKHKVQK